MSRVTGQCIVYDDAVGMSTDPWYCAVWNCPFEMWTSYVLSILSVALASEFELIENGWRPVSNVVFNQIQREVTLAPWYPTTDDSKLGNTDLLSITEHKEYEEYDSKDDITNENKDECQNGECIDNDVIIEDIPKYEYIYSPNKFLPFEDQKVETEINVRRSKKLVEKEPLINNEIEAKHKKVESKNTIQDNNKLTQQNDVNIHTYEVTENILIEEVKQEPTIKKRGYEYNPPDKQNFTKNFINHLAKYNINENDNLQNYALSRQPKTHLPVKPNIHKPFQFLLPMRYNSLNHLPVDPLLAVFLSNYGYYLQGQYGIRNNYNNLYGYLASNNIHNNRPFGFYKLFSDTDSSL